MKDIKTHPCNNKSTFMLYFGASGILVGRMITFGIKPDASGNIL